MARKYLFVDEAGNMDFSDRSSGASEYFILTSVLMESCESGDELLRLRRAMAWDDIHLESDLHASEDPQAVRDQVFAVLQNHQFRVDSTILEKRKTIPRLQADKERFYKQAWYMHFKYVAQRAVNQRDELLVVIASWGTKSRRRAIKLSLEDVVAQVTSCDWRVAFWEAHSEPCLLVADYCSWALQRKHERGDTRSYDLIKDKVRSEFKPFDRGNTAYY